jgi:SAM-dependent methyltransferase
VIDQKPGADDWDRHWEDLTSSMVLNPALGYRLHLILTALELGSGRGVRILDIGSGIGDFLLALNADYPDIPKLGLELARTGVDVAKRRVPGATFLQKDLSAAPTTSVEYPNFATHAVCSEVLEHVDDPVRLLKNSRAYMADGCRLVVTVPGGPRSAFDVHIGHRRHFTPEALSRVLRAAGFKVDFSSGAGFPFFNLYRLLVILRGRKLVEDATGVPSNLLRFTSTVFRTLFHLNMDRSRFGWQIIASAIK